MNKQQMAFWRVGAVVLGYGIVYIGNQDLVDWWLLVCLIPLYILLKPAPESICTLQEKRHREGIVFYFFKNMIKMMAIIGVVAALVALQWQLPLGQLLGGLAANSMLVAPLLACFFANWVVDERHYKAHCLSKKSNKTKQKRPPRKS